MTKRSRERNELVAIYLKTMGFKPGWSHGIHEGYTCGYGDLDFNGFWQFPLIDEAEEAEKE